MRVQKPTVEKQYAQWVKGQRVIVVGPAEYLVGRGWGEWIDSHDIVARLNWGVPVPEGMEADYGQRTDVLYKRLLKLGIIDHIDVNEWLAAGVQWCVAVQGRTKPGNFEHLERMLEGKIPYFVDIATRRRLRDEMRNSPLIGITAIAHLLQHEVASVTVTGCDFYQTGYHTGYGGREYRESQGRKEHNPLSPKHNAALQFRHLVAMRKREPRLVFDEHLDGLARKAVVA